jgi:uncharacterized membrane protein YgcG
VASGEPFTENQSREISRACRQVSADTGLDFSVFVGPVNGSVREYARRLHAALRDRAADAVLVCVAPGERRVEIVTGRQAKERLPDRSCALAVMSMCSSFTGGDLVGGILNGLQMLANTAGRLESSR